MEEHDIIADTLAEITRHFLRAADAAGWDEPAQLAALDVRPVTDLDPDALDERLGVAWELRAPVPVPGHPFASVLATEFPSDAIGVLFAVEGWMTHETELGDDDPLSADAAVHRGPDGRTEVRMAIALLTDGTRAQFCQVRGGAVHPFTGEFAGRIPSALRLLLGNPSGETADCTPYDVCHLAWTWMAVSVAAAWADTDDDELLAAAGDQPPAAAALLAATEPGLSTLALPEWFVWLAGHLGEGWDRVLDDLRTADDGHHLMGWLLAAATDPEVLDEWTDDDERLARARCDAGMLAMLADGSTPVRSQLLEAFDALAARAPLSMSVQDLDSLADLAVARLSSPR